MQITSKTKLTAVIGYPIKHSLSPALHNELYAREHVDAVMLAFANPDINALVSAIRALPVHLCAVTLPHKQAIIPLIDEVDERARRIGAVNTVINADGKLTGYNTDVVGIAAALSSVELNGKSALLMGAGGVAQALAHHLKERGAKMFCRDRTAEKSRALCEKFGGAAIGEDEMLTRAFDVIINATPVGLEPNVDASPIPAEIIRAGATVFDLVYGPRETKLIRDAKERSARAISGISMFLEQAMEQERLWLGKEIQAAEYATFLKSQL